MQSEFDLYYRRYSGQLVLEGGNFDNQLDCQQVEQTVWQTYAGREMWRVESRSTFRNVWSVLELQFLMGPTCNVSL